MHIDTHITSLPLSHHQVFQLQTPFKDQFKDKFQQISIFDASWLRPKLVGLESAGDLAIILIVNMYVILIQKRARAKHSMWWDHEGQL